MAHVRTLLAAGLIACASGCTNLNQGLLFRPASQPAAVDRGAAADVPPDLFHRPAETPTARLSRFFPGLTRTEKVTPPASEASRRKAANPDLRAIPRDASTEDQEATASRPRTGRPRSPRAEETASRRPVPVNPTGAESGSLPLLAAGVVAETDPEEPARRREALPELTPAQQELRAVRVAEMSTVGARSVRRMPPVPDTNPAPARRSPAVASAGRSGGPSAPRPASRDEDSQARQVRARVEDNPAPIESKGAGAAPIAQAEPEGPRSLAPPVAEAEARPVDPPVPPDQRAQPIASEPSAVEAAKPEPEPEPAEAEADGPPPIEPPSAGPASRKDAKPEPAQARSPADPDTGGNPILAGRARMPRLDPIRDHVPPDLPPVAFPRTYYSPRDIARATARPKVDAETRPARWTWTPRILRRLRGGDAAVRDNVAE